jgi:hypothetical protein
MVERKKKKWFEENKRHEKGNFFSLRHHERQNNRMKFFRFSLLRREKIEKNRDWYNFFFLVFVLSAEKKSGKTTTRYILRWFFFFFSMAHTQEHRVEKNDIAPTGYPLNFFFWFSEQPWNKIFFVEEAKRIENTSFFARKNCSFFYNYSFDRKKKRFSFAKFFSSSTKIRPREKLIDSGWANREKKNSFYWSICFFFRRSFEIDNVLFCI